MKIRRGVSYRVLLLVFVAHGAVVLAGATLSTLLWDKSVVSWYAYRIIRIVDAPALWLIDHVLARMPLYHPLGLAEVANVTVAHALIGGVLYCMVARVIMIAWFWRRAERHQIASKGRH